MGWRTEGGGSKWRRGWDPRKETAACFNLVLRRLFAVPKDWDLEWMSTKTNESGLYFKWLLSTIWNSKGWKPIFSGSFHRDQILMFTVNTEIVGILQSENLHEVRWSTLGLSFKLEQKNWEVLCLCGIMWKNPSNGRKDPDGQVLAPSPQHKVFCFAYFESGLSFEYILHLLIVMLYHGN